MANFFKSLFGGNSESEKQKTDQKNFEIFKYDGLRAQRMGRADYAVKCFNEALQLEEDFETMSYLAELYIQMHEMPSAHDMLQRMIKLEPTLIKSYLLLAHVCFMQSNYAEMKEVAEKAVEVDAENPAANFLLGKAEHELHNDIMAIAHLTKAIVLKDDYLEARLLRAEILLSMNQLKDASEDLDAILTQQPDEEAALLLRGKLKEAENKEEEAEVDYRKIIELNPFNEQAFLYLGQLYIKQEKATEAIALLDEAIELNPNFAKAYQERGRAKLMNGDQAGSIEDAQKAMELNPNENDLLNGTFNNQESQAPKDIWQI